MSALRPVIAIELSQFADHPIATGVQRVLRGVLHEWPSRRLEPLPCFQDGNEYRLVELADAVRSLDDIFRHPNSGDQARSRLYDAPTVAVSADSLTTIADGYLLAEPCFDYRVLATATHWSRTHPDSTFAILHDALPQADPDAFDSPDGSDTSPYFRWVASLDNVASVSAGTRDQLARMSRREAQPGWVVLPPGANSLTRVRPSPEEEPESPRFIALGTVEPRKRIDTLLDGFERLWDEGRRYSLVVVGREGWSVPETVERLDRLTRQRPDLVEWRRTSNDGELERLLSSASGLVYLSDNEGYGLPPLEALWVGCPVIVSSGLPSLVGLPERGQIRLADVTPAAIADAIDRLGRGDSGIEPGNPLDLPTWKSFGEGLGNWITSALSR